MPMQLDPSLLQKIEPYERKAWAKRHGVSPNELAAQVNAIRPPQRTPSR
jgi:hypothetical protein